MSDREIIDLLFNRDERGIDAIEKAYGKRLLRIAGGLLSSEDAKECVNDTYLSLWTHIPPSKPDNLFAYAVRILKNLAKDRFRAANVKKRGQETVSLSEELSDCIPDPTADTEEEAIFGITEALNRFLDQQERTKRNIFVLYYWYGMSIEEIAKRYGKTKAGTEKILNRMKNALKAFLKEE